MVTNDFLFWIGILFLAPVSIPVILVFELVRYLRIRLLISKFPASFCLKSPIQSCSIRGLAASIRSKVLMSNSDAIFHYRTKFAEETNGVYLAYDWSLSSLYSSNDTAVPNVNLVLSDASFVTSVLSQTESFVKFRLPSGNPMWRIIALACTNSHGDDAKRQRKILMNSMKGYSKVYLNVIQNSGSKLIKQLHAYCETNLSHTSSNQNNNTFVAVDMFPVLLHTSLELMCTILFGQSTDTIMEFSSKFLPFWDLVRQNTTGQSENEKRIRASRLDIEITEITRLLVAIIMERKTYIQSRQHGDSVTSDVCMLDGLISQTDFESTKVVGQRSPPNYSIPATTTYTDALTTEVLPPAQIATSTEKSTTIPVQYTLEELVHNLHNILTASFETTAHTIGVTLYHLAMHTEVQQIIYDTLQLEESKTQSSEGSLSLSRFSGCPIQSSAVTNSVNSTNHVVVASYTNNTVSTLSSSILIKAVIKESLRLLPPVMSMRRETAKKATITGSLLPNKAAKSGTNCTYVSHTEVDENSTALTVEDTVTCPVGSIITIDIVAMHRRIAVWGDDAYEFRIQRWLSRKQQQSVSQLQVGNCKNKHSEISVIKSNSSSGNTNGSGSKLYSAVNQDEGKSCMKHTNFDLTTGSGSDVAVTTIDVDIEAPRSVQAQQSHVGVMNTIGTDDENERYALQLALQNKYWLPFGGTGMRNCLGQGLAMIIIEQISLMVLKDFEFKSVEDYNPQFIQAPTLKFTNGLWMNICARK